MTSQQNIKRTLFGYWRSSASYRVRIALNLKALSYEQTSLNLVKGEHRDDAFLLQNPQALVPMLTEESVGEGSDNDSAETSTFSLSQSSAIVDYLDEMYPDRPLLPKNVHQRAQIRSLSQIIACEVHPLDNLRVLQYLVKNLNVDESNKMIWYRHWIDLGFSALEQRLPNILGGNLFSLGEKPGYLEAFLIPQVYNAKRFECQLDHFPKIQALSNACLALPAFIQAMPENQPDAI